MELNKIYLDSDFSNTVVPVGQRFLFLGYYDGIEGSEIVIRYKDSDGNFGNIASGSTKEEPKEQYIEINSLSNGFIVVNSGSIPVFIKTSLGNFYPIEKDTLFQNNESFYIDATPYLAYDNVVNFSGVWRVYLSNGAKGDSLRYDEVGKFSDRSKYDDKPYKFSFLATDQSFIYIKLSNYSGDWSDPISLKGDKGDKGDRGLTGATGPTGQIGPQGLQGNTGPAGQDGYTPRRGVDYWTNVDILEIKNYCESAILSGEW